MSGGILLKSNLPYQASRKLQKCKTCNARENFSESHKLVVGKFCFFLENWKFLLFCPFKVPSIQQFQILSLNTFLSYKARCGGRHGCGTDNEPKYLCFEELPFSSCESKRKENSSVPANMQHQYLPTERP